MTIMDYLLIAAFAVAGLYAISRLFLGWLRSPVEEISVDVTHREKSGDQPRGPVHPTAGTFSPTHEIHAEKSPEQKLILERGLAVDRAGDVRPETTRAKTLYVGDEINDAPAMMAPRAGIEDGQAPSTSA